MIQGPELAAELLKRELILNLERPLVAFGSLPGVVKQDFRRCSPAHDCSACIVSLSYLCQCLLSQH